MASTQALAGAGVPARHVHSFVCTHTPKIKMDLHSRWLRWPLFPPPHATRAQLHGSAGDNVDHRSFRCPVT